MGGNLFKKYKVKTVRLNKDQYIEVEKKVLESLRETFPEGDFRATSYYKDKETFGDVDILFSFPDDRGVELMNDTLSETVTYFGHNRFIRGDEVTSYVKSGEVTSFAVPVNDEMTEFFQVDLIRCLQENMEFADNYYGNGDFGVFLGRIARMLGFKLGQYGLLYPYSPKKHPDHVSDVVVTKDFDQALIMMGYNPEEYHAKKFDSIEDVFDYTVSSQYFSDYPYTDGSQNHAQRKRLKKRNTFVQLNDYIAKNKIESKITRDDVASMRAMTDGKVRLMPEVVAKFNQIDDAVEERDRKKKLFNGGMVMSVTGLTGPDVGLFIAAFKKDFMSQYNLSDTDDFIEKTAELGVDNMRNSIKEFYHSYQS